MLSFFLAVYEYILKTEKGKKKEEKKEGEKEEEEDEEKETNDHYGRRRRPLFPSFFFFSSREHFTRVIVHNHLRSRKFSSSLCKRVH